MKFYYKNDIRIAGPFTAKEMLKKDLSPDTMLSEQTIDGGQWKLLGDIDLGYYASDEQVPLSVDSELQLVDDTIIESGLDPQERLPECIDKWNWGAFAIFPIWGIVHGIIWPIGVAVAFGIIIAIIIDATLSSFIYPIPMIAISLFVGAKGNKWAWYEKKEPRDADKFDKSQKVWNKIGIIYLIVGIVCYIFNHFIFS